MGELKGELESQDMIESIGQMMTGTPLDKIVKGAA
jgi:hypothetical protein